MKIVRSRESEFTPASHEDSRDPGCLKKVLATKDDLIFGQVQMVNWSKMPIGKSFQKHYHEDLQECFVLIDGVVEVWVDGDTHQLSGGDLILIEPREVHQMTNIGANEVSYVVFGISSGKGGKTVNVN